MQGFRSGLGQGSSWVLALVSCMSGVTNSSKTGKQENIYDWWHVKKKMKQRCAEVRGFFGWSDREMFLIMI